MQENLRRRFSKIFIVILTMLLAVTLISCSDKSIVEGDIAKENKDKISQLIKAELSLTQETEDLIDKFIGEQLTSIPLIDEKGVELDILDLAEDYDEFILEFMAPWCPACVNAVDDLTTVNEEVKVINVVVGANDYKDIEEFKRVAQSSLDYYLSTDSTVLDDYNLMYVPTAFYIKNKEIWGVLETIDTDKMSKIKEITKEV